MSDKVTARVLELGAFQHPTLAPWVFTAYRKTISSQPKLYSVLYRKKQQKELGRMTKLALHRLFYARTASIIRQLKPALIVATHPFPTLVVSRLKRSGLSIPLCTIITDYDVHAAWVDPAVDKYLVSTPEMSRKLITLGVRPSNIQVTGIPVHPKFWVTHDKEEVRRQFGLKDMPTVLVMGGGWGLINDEAAMDYTVSWRDKLQLIFVLGNNEKALARYREDERFQHPNVKVLGYTKDVDKLMDAADLLLTKPGGMTCTEGLAKGIPMLFYCPIPGPESQNLQYFIDHGLGESITSLEVIRQYFTRLVDDYPSMEEERRRRREAAGFYDARDCPKAVLDFLEQSANHVNP